MQLTTQHRTLLLAFLSGLSVFLYGMAEILGKLQTWAIVYEPPTIGRFCFYAAGGIGAMLAALKLDLGEVNLLSMFRPKTPPGQ